MVLKRRDFVRVLSSFAGATLLDGCLDNPIQGIPRAGPPPAAVDQDLRGVCDAAPAVTGGDMALSPHPWPGGLGAAALIDVDDLCPVLLPADGLDFGGDL